VWISVRCYGCLRLSRRRKRQRRFCCPRSSNPIHFNILTASHRQCTMHEKDVSGNASAGLQLSCRRSTTSLLPSRKVTRQLKRQHFMHPPNLLHPSISRNSSRSSLKARSPTRLGNMRITNPSLLEPPSRRMWQLRFRG